MRLKRNLSLFLILLLSCFSVLYAQDTDEHVLNHRIELDFNILNTVDYYGNLYIRFHAFLPSVLTFVNNDGSVTVCTSDDSAKVTWIYEFGMDLTEQKRFSIPNEHSMLGAFTKDNEGNYYIFYAGRATKTTDENMIIAKYDQNGEKVNTFKMQANPRDGFSTVKIPFDAGTCRLEISGSMLAVYFAHERFDGHQASFGFIIDKDSFTRIDKGHAYYYQNGTYPKNNNLLPFTGHSFNQFILPIENGFLIADHGDAYPRAFTFGKFQNGSSTIRLNAFKFPGNIGANATYAEMGGLVKTSDGFLFFGSYGTNANNARNIFILTMDENLSRCSNPVYITKYTRNDGHAGHPKIVSINDGRYIILWEFFSFSTQAANIVAGTSTGYISTFALIIDENGDAVSEIQEYKGIRLNINDTLRYNPHNGAVYWAINDTSKSITVYGLDVRKIIK